ncbi:hypothetical protein EIN_341350 [Entamoeba invadens IP1]|uniref:Uncharacterized protein n=1 Tax=Entamoeba invadens IP1 TaxID=370355 RepID=A0A0A1UE42_ENTIV|nr:hypothetical protein EIN_341350 [Entamoeba invadens IP1]ELP94757.1 hypothetical protein EIN_341350 [Entamoeba invadens IP1]|eukprot:XP_004261528.1 hypothetical protein EIN_341350 [Entamoeba invadens IP1]
MHRMKRHEVIYEGQEITNVQRISQIEAELSAFATEILNERKLKYQTVRELLNFMCNTYNLKEKANPYTLYFKKLKLFLNNIKITTGITEKRQLNLRQQTALHVKYYRNHLKWLEKLRHIEDLKEDAFLKKTVNIIKNFIKTHEKILKSCGFTEQEMMDMNLRPFKTKFRRVPNLRSLNDN